MRCSVLVLTRSSGGHRWQWTRSICGLNNYRRRESCRYMSRRTQHSKNSREFWIKCYRFTPRHTKAFQMGYSSQRSWVTGRKGPKRLKEKDRVAPSKGRDSVSLLLPAAWQLKHRGRSLSPSASFQLQPITRRARQDLLHGKQKGPLRCVLGPRFIL